MTKRGENDTATLTKVNVPQQQFEAYVNQLNPSVRRSREKIFSLKTYQKLQPNEIPCIKGPFKIDNGNFCHAIISQAEFNHVTFTNGNFMSSNLSGSTCVGSNLSGSAFYQASLKDANLAGCNFCKTSFTESTLENADFCGAKVEDMRFPENVTVTNTNFIGCNLPDKTAQLLKINGAIITADDLLQAITEKKIDPKRGYEFVLSMQNLAAKELDVEKKSLYNSKAKECVEALIQFPFEQWHVALQQHHHQTLVLMPRTTYGLCAHIMPNNTMPLDVAKKLSGMIPTQDFPSTASVCVADVPEEKKKAMDSFLDKVKASRQNTTPDNKSL